MSVTQKQLKEHFLNLGKKGAIYVWGANGQTITAELMTKLHRSFGSSKYNKEYYNNKLKEGKGKIGADCSGSLYPVSGYDTTASGYYSKCLEKGDMSSLPANKVCLVFRKNSKGVINHVGCYTGDGYVSEMASSQINYQRKKINVSSWDLWGMPNFVSDPTAVQEDPQANTTKASDTKMPTIKRGSKGKAVRVWQVIIGMTGDYVDGIFGADTEIETKEFQKKAFPNAKDEWDGVVGPKSWKAGLESI